MINRQNIKKTSSNLQNNGLLLKLYTAYNNTIDLISDYLYFSIITSEYDYSASQIFENIATEKIQSFKILGELLKSKGVDPSINATIKTSGTNLYHAAEDIRTDSSMIKSISETLIMYENDLLTLLSAVHETIDSAAQKRILNVCDIGKNHISVLKGM